MRGHTGSLTPHPLPNESVNSRYDKNYCYIHDKYKAAALHLGRLENIKKEIKTIKRDPTTSNEKHAMDPDFYIKGKSEVHRFTI